MSQSLFCRVCKKQFTRSDNYKRHLQSAVHLDKLRQVEISNVRAPAAREPAASDDLLETPPKAIDIFPSDTSDDGTPETIAHSLLDIEAVREGPMHNEDPDLYDIVAQPASDDEEVLPLRERIAPRVDEVLAAKIVTLRRKNEKLKEEKASSVVEAEYWKTMFEKAVEEKTGLEKRLKELENGAALNEKSPANALCDARAYLEQKIGQTKIRSRDQKRRISSSSDDSNSVMNREMQDGSKKAKITSIENGH